MKYLFTGLLTVCVLSAGAQCVCRVYQTPADMSTSKKLVLTKKTDEQGRVVHEEARGYTFFLDNINTMYSNREDGTYEYYYDSVHYKTVFKELDDVTHRPIDSNKIFYYYDEANTNMLLKEVSVKHLKKRIPGMKPGSFRNTITYTYDKNGKVSEKAGTYGDKTVEYLVYDNNGRLTADSVRGVGVKEDFCMVSRYEYTADGYREYAWACDRKYPIITVFKMDDHKRIVEQTLWFHKDDDKGGTKALSLPTGWDDYLNNDFKKYREYEKTVVKYDDKGRISESFYYFEGKHTTTHSFVYENVDAASSRL